MSKDLTFIDYLNKLPRSNHGLVQGVYATRYTTALEHHILMKTVPEDAEKFFNETAKEAYEYTMNGIASDPWYVEHFDIEHKVQEAA